MPNLPPAEVDIRWPRSRTITLWICVVCVGALSIGIAAVISANWNTLQALGSGPIWVFLGVLPFLITGGGFAAARRATEIAVIARGDTLTIVSMFGTRSFAKHEIDDFRSADSSAFVLLRSGPMLSMAAVGEVSGGANGRVEGNVARLKSWLGASLGPS